MPSIERAKAQLDEHGYCVIESVLEPSELIGAKEALRRAADDDIGRGRAFLEEDGANQRVANLLNRGDAFVQLAQSEVAMQLMEHLLGPGFLLSSITANITGPGGKAMKLHADQGAVPLPWNYPTVANVMWMLDDFTTANGATRVVPGSHRQNVKAADTDPAGTISIEAPAGSLLCFEGRLLHGTGANTTTDRRRFGVLAYYCLPWVRPQENVFLSLDPLVLERATDRLLQLLGYLMHGNLPLGMVDGRPWAGLPGRPATKSGLALGEGLGQEQ